MLQLVSATPTEARTGGRRSPDPPGPATAQDRPTPRFHLRSSAFCPLAQRAMVALAVRGSDWSHDASARDGEPSRLTVTSARAPVRDEGDPVAMLDLIEALHPGQPLLPADPARRAPLRALMELGVEVQECLSAVTRATASNDHDIAVYRLRLRLLLAEDLAPEGPEEDPLDLAGVVFGPTLWRMRVLDQHCQSFLLTGLDRLGRWERVLSRHPALRAVLPPTAEWTYLATLRRRGAALLSVTDASAWRPLLGHGGLRGAG